MVYKEKRILNIKAGPGKMDAIMSMAYAYGPSSCLVFDVTDASGAIYPVVFTSMCHEDGSGESFNVTGFIDYSYPRYADKTRRYSRASDLPNRFSGYYNAKTREGTFTVEVLTADGRRTI